MSLLLGSVLRWIHSYVRAGHSGAYRTLAYWELEPHTRSPRPGPQTLLTCSYAPVSVLTWLRFQGAKGLPGSYRSKGFKVPRAKGSSKKFHGEGIGRPILACLYSSILLSATLYFGAIRVTHLINVLNLNGDVSTVAQRCMA